MRIRHFPPLILAVIFSTIGGAAAGYAIGRQDYIYIQEPAGTFPIQYMAAASPPALEITIADTIIEQEDSPRYLLSTDHGFVAVFYVQDKTLKERTRTPASALPFDERQRLLRGIPIYTEEQLTRLLQDYGS